MTCATGQRYYSTGQAALHFGVLEWQVLQLYKRGLVPEPERLGRFRMIGCEQLPAIGAALRAAGYLPRPEPRAACQETP